MNYFKTIKYYTERDMINLSRDQVIKRINHIRNNRKNHETIVKKIKVGRTYAWAINYQFLDLFKRERALGQKRKKLKQKHQIKHSNINYRMDYNFEISINLREGSKTSYSQTYDQSYYKTIAEEIFKIVRQDLLYVHEVDKYGYNHIHMAINGEEDDIRLAIDFTMIHKLGFDHKFLKSSRAIHFEPLDNIHAYRQYLKKLQHFPTFGAIPTNQENYIYVEQNYEEQ